DTVHCRYLDYQRKELVPASKTVVFPEFTSMCPPVKEQRIFLSQKNTTTRTILPCRSLIVQTKDILVPTHYFAACLAPLYGVETKWLLLAEFIEHHKLQ
ncbi:hypothetical protein KIN20_020233, partial [Parelaphostrongylus tenuis]